MLRPSLQPVAVAFLGALALGGGVLWQLSRPFTAVVNQKISLPYREPETRVTASGSEVISPDSTARDPSDPWAAADPTWVVRERHRLRAELNEARRSESEVAACNDLQSVPLLELDPAGRARRSFRITALAARTPANQVLHAPDLVGTWPDLTGLPFLGQDACRLDDTQAHNLERLSLRMRRALADDRKHLVAFGLPTDFLSRSGLPRDRVGGLVQVLTGQPAWARRMLVDWLKDVTDRSATDALARLALYDPAREIRDAAIDVLHYRPREDYRPALLAGFRYPWPGVADNAAHALVRLRDVDAVPELVRLLDEPDPCAPFRDGDDFAVREVVRINHLRGCLLCHAPSTSVRDRPAALVPSPSRALPIERYYDDANRQPGDVFVRADVTYLRQDFSALLPVDDAGSWPALQRFDFVVRTRRLDPAEVERLQRPSAAYPQQLSVMVALNELRR